MSGFFYGTAPRRPVMQYAAPTTGQTVTALVNVEMIMLDPAGTLATLTVIMPPTPFDGQECVIATSQVITALTVTGTIVGALTTLALGGFARFIWSATGAKWFRAG